MSFLWPWFLLLLLLAPLLIGVYVWVLHRKRRFAVRYSSLSLIREAIPKRSRWRQHVPFALFLLGLACLATAVARPVAAIEIPLSRTTIVLAMDVSGSMCSTDVTPNRLAVAQQAALDFIQDQADDTRIGIVAFAGFAQIVVPPTNDRKALQQAIKSLTTSMGTAIGSATLKSIDAIAEVNESVAPSGVDLSSAVDDTPTEDGFYQPDIIVVLTDGASNRGSLPLDAAEKAADRRVRIYTIGFGSTNPGQMVCTPEQLGSGIFRDRFGGGFDDRFGSRGGFGRGGGFGRYLLLDEPTLQGMADATGGAYYRAQDSDQLYDVFANLPTEIVLQKEHLEISAFFAVLGAAFAATAVTLSLIWHRFP